MALEQAIFAAKDRIWSKIVVGEDDDCWIWIAGLANGYGHLNIDGKFIQATHAVFCLTHGRLPKLQLLHSCDNPPCCNPKHLHEGTQAENLLERSLRGRAPTGDKHWSHRMPERIARGDRHGSRLYPRPRKLDQDKHSEIYCRYLAGERQKDLAKQFQVSPQLVSLIVVRARAKECTFPA